MSEVTNQTLGVMSSSGGLGGAALDGMQSIGNSISAAVKKLPSSSANRSSQGFIKSSKDTLSSLVKRNTHEGKTDLLLRYFESQFFDEWVALQYLYQNSQNGVQDYLCNKLYELTEPALERFLLQLVYLAVSKPGSPLEKTIVNLCSKSFRVAVKVHWLLKALSQDTPKNKEVEKFLGNCADAALSGKWEVPFRDPHLYPLSPRGASSPSPSPPFSPDSSAIFERFTNHMAVGLVGPMQLIPTTEPPQEMSMVSSPPPGMVMNSASGSSPPSRGEMAVQSKRGFGGLGSQGFPSMLSLMQAGEAPPHAIPHRGSSIAIDLGCLMPTELNTSFSGKQRGQLAEAQQQQQLSTGTERTSLTCVTRQQQQPLAPQAAAATAAAAAAAAVRRSSGSTGITAVQFQGAWAANPLNPERMDSLRQELGEGEGVTALLERIKCGNGYILATEEDGLMSDDDAGPMSPTQRLRHDTYGATVDFMDALCDASSSLTTYSQEERHRMLRVVLETLNREIETANRRDDAIWFPMGCCHERILRLTAKEAVLLNSREKAPFMLFVEVLEDEEPQIAAMRASADAASCSATLKRVQSTSWPSGLNTVSSHCADSLQSMTTGSSIGSRFRSTDSAYTPDTVSSRCASPDPPYQQPSRLSSFSGLTHSRKHSSSSNCLGAQSLSPTLSDAGNNTFQAPHVTATRTAANTSHSSATQPMSRSGSTTHTASLPSAQSAMSSEAANAVDALNTSGVACLQNAVNAAGLHNAAATLSLQNAADAASLQNAAATASLQNAPTIASLYNTWSGPSDMRPIAHMTENGVCTIPARSNSGLRKLSNSASSSMVCLVEGAKAAASAAGVGEIVTAAAVAAAAEASALPAPQPVATRVAVSGSSKKRLTVFDRESTSALSGVVRSLCFKEPQVVTDAKPIPASPPRKAGGIPLPKGRESGLTGEEIADLVATGCLPGHLPPINPDRILGAKIAGVMASLRGEAPMIRVHIKVLCDSVARVSIPAQQTSTSDPTLVTANATNNISSSSKPSLTAPSLDMQGMAQPSASPPQQQQTGFPWQFSGLGLGSKTSATASSGRVGVASAEAVPPRADSQLLSDQSQFGSAQDGPGLSNSVLTNLAVVAPASGSMAVASPGDTQLASAGSSGSKGLSLFSKIGMRLRQTLQDTDVAAPVIPEQPEKLISLRLEIAGGLDLTIASPYRKGKSRRTPSVEGINIVAGKYKLHHLAAPYECGPPLGPEDAAASGLSFPSLPRPTLDTIYSPVSSTLSPGFLSPTPSVIPAAPAATSSSWGFRMPSFSILTGAASALAAVVEGRQQLMGSGVSLLSTSTSGTPGAAACGGSSAAAAAAAAASTTAPSVPASTCPGTSSSAEELASSPEQQRQQHRSDHSDVGLTMGEQARPAHVRQLWLEDLEELEPWSDTPGAQMGERCAGGMTPSDPSPTAGSALPSPSQASRSQARIPPFTEQQQSHPALHPHPDPRADSVNWNSSSGHADFSNPMPHTASQQQQPDVHPVPCTSVVEGVLHLNPALQLPSHAVVGVALFGRGGTVSTMTVPPGGRSVVVSPLGHVVPVPRPMPMSLAERRSREACAVYGERWSQKEARIKRDSPQGRRKGWALRCVIVKSGDDCRQELLAMQLIRAFHDMFIEAGLLLWVRPYEVLVTSNKTALIEMIPNSLSIHTVKHRSPAGTSFSDHFFAKFIRGSPACVVAQRKFTESLASYSIICYLLQIKDRHNGNILVDDEGHIIHIDFGFMLSNSPGGVNFEAAPFKLTRELLEVMDSNSEGRASQLFDYYKVLMIQGFLVARKNSERLVQLVKMMSKSNYPCFKARDGTVKAMEKRFALNLTEAQSVQEVLRLISDSLDAWRTRQYDYYQRILNGIL